jgi:hypothetical protein
MALDLSQLEVPALHEEPAAPHLAEQLTQLHQQPQATALSELTRLLFQLNRSGMTLLERQRALQSFGEAYRLQIASLEPSAASLPLLVRFCSELAIGYKRLLLQMLHGRPPSRPHLAWCLYTAQYFLSQCMLRQYQLYQEPAPGQWRDSHLLYWLAEQQGCLEEPVAAAFQPRSASTPRGLYQQLLLLAQSNPFHLDEGEAPLLFGALAPFAELAQLLPWEADDDSPGLMVNLAQAQPCVPCKPDTQDADGCLRRFELGPLLIALNDPTPLQSAQQQSLLAKVRPQWLGENLRRHERNPLSGDCSLVVGLPAIHAQLLAQRPAQRPAQCPVRILDASAGGARLLCNLDQALPLQVGQLVLMQPAGSSSTLAMIRWRYQNSQGLHLGLRYLKGLPRPVWLRRTPSTNTHPGVLQSTPVQGNGWHHGLWLPNGQFGEGDSFWLQLINVNQQTMFTLPASNLGTPSVQRYPLRLA